MTTNFTFRDFFVYLIVGIVLIFSISTIFFQHIFNYSLIFFKKYHFIKEFSFLVIMFLLPIVYILGHIAGGISYYFFRLHKRIVKTWKPSTLIVIVADCCLFKQRVGYAIEKTLLFAKEDEFWAICAELQTHQNYGYAEYWYVLNELFNSLNIVFLLTCLCALYEGNFHLAILYFLLAFFAFGRAKQYAFHFVKTVLRLKKSIPIVKAVKT